MPDAGIELTDREQRVLEIGFFGSLVVLIVGWIVWAYFDAWWLFAIGGFMTVGQMLASTIYIARTRRRTFASIAALSVPEPLKTVTPRIAVLMALAGVGSFVCGLASGRPWGAGLVGPLLVGVCGATACLMLLTPDVPDVESDHNEYWMGVAATGVVVFGSFVDTSDEREFHWSPELWALPVGLLMLAACIRRWLVWKRALGAAGRTHGGWD